MKSTGAQRDTASTETPIVKSPDTHFPDGKVTVDCMATAVYYNRVLSRDFAPGKEIEDWLGAEAELRKQTVG